MTRLLVVPLAVSLLGGGCRPRPQAVGEALLAADRAFARESQLRGLDAWLEAVADSGLVLQAGHSLARGREATRERLAPVFADTAATFNWEPVFAGAAASGDLGYTVGLTQSGRDAGRSGPSIRTGKYVTIWRRQADGTWKVALRVDVGDGR